MLRILTDTNFFINILNVLDEMIVTEKCDNKSQVSMKNSDAWGPTFRSNPLFPTEKSCDVWHESNFTKCN